MMSCIKGQNAENRVSIEMDSAIYHEKQSKEMCALHALNNLFQDQNAFTRKHLDEMCFRLSPNNMINPHKSVLGLGNYDVNVIMASLQTKGFQAVWFDKRKNIECLALENIMGFILNIPTEYKWGIFRLPFHRKHWIGIREISGLYYNLDSKLDAPEIIGKIAELQVYLKEQIEDKDKELLLVVRTAVDEARTWYRDVRVDAGTPKPDDVVNQNGSLSASGVALETSGWKELESPNYASHLDAEKLVLSFYKDEQLRAESMRENGNDSTAEVG
ncbi:josephin-1-like [Lineus longissimus]|uniref:josephin-1-like n=1 Tax=Lineus longissimus TaxID=88925 RepID=UPI002B4F3AC0